jgi:predicted tellurium resistance membrane protein TerC
MLEFLSDPQTYISFLSLALLEIVLGIDNIIFISILAGKLPEEQRDKARIYGLMLALFGRLALLFSLSWLAKLTEPFLEIGEWVHFSGKDLVLLVGGLFLIAKSANEIYEKVEGGAQHINEPEKLQTTFMAVLAQILMIDIVFSLDSIITAVGLVSNIPIMVAAIIVSLAVMIVASKSISGFIEKHPSIKVLALSFLLMIGTMLVAESFHVEIPKGYIYFALTFSLFVEWLNIRAHTRAGGHAHAVSSAEDQE